MATRRRAPVPARKPPRGREWEAAYARRMRVFHEAWAAHVREYARAQFGRRDARNELDLRAMLGQIVDAVGVRSLLSRAARKMASANRRYVEQVTRVPIISMQSAGAEAIAAWQETNLGLIRTLGERDIQRVGEIIRPIQARGGRWEDAAAEIEKTIGASRKRARLIARDQVAKWNSETQAAAQASAGITQYRWSTSRDFAVRGRPGGEYAKSRENHWELEGTIHSWDNPPRIPGTNERAHPGQRIQCRCVAVPVVPWLDALGDGAPLVRPAEIVAQERAAGFPRRR